MTDSNLFIESSTPLDRQHDAYSAQSYDAYQRLSQQVFSTTRTDAPLSAQDSSQQKNDLGGDLPAKNKVDQLVELMQHLPGSFQLTQSQLSEVLKQAGLDKDPQIETIVGGVTKFVKKDNHIELQRDSETHIPLNEDIVKGLISIKSVDLDSIKFDVDLKSDPKQVSNISGVALSFTAFGGNTQASVEEAKLSHDENGNTVITGLVENPIPAAAREFLDLGDRIPVTIKLTPDGHFIAPLASKVIQSAANTTGGSLPGLIMHDELTDAAEVAQFAEKYPKWMGDTVQPILTGLEKVIEENQQKTAEDGKKKGNEAAQAAPQTKIQPGSIGVPGADKSPVPETRTETKTSDVSKSIPNGPGEYDRVIKVDGSDRHYILHVPPNYDSSRPMPMILALHGMGGNAADFEQRTGLNSLADKQGFIVVYPDSTDWFNQKNWKTWDTGDGIIPPGKHVDDTKFLRTIIDTTQSQLNVDNKRIYMAGVSNGGMMTMHAAGALSDKLAAVAVVSGAMSGREQSPSQPLSVINIHGTEDSIIPINGIENVPDSLTLLGIPTFKPNSYIPNYWSIKDGITAAPITEKIGNETRQHYINPKTGVEVEQIVVAGGEHVPKNIGPTMNTVVQFFEDHPKVTVTSDSVPPADNPPRDTHEPVDPVARLIADVKKRGITGIEADVDRALAAVPSLSDGKVSPSDLYNKIDATLHQNFNDPVSSFIKTSESLSKSGEHIELKRTNTASVPLNFDVPGTGGLLNLKDLQIGTTSFDLHNQNGLFSIDNLKGLSIKSRILGHDLTSNITQVTESTGANGNHVYNVKVSHPLPAFARFVLMQPDNISVKVQLDEQGTPVVVNQNEIMDDALGRNPLVRGVIDEGTDVKNVVTNPSLSSVGNVLKDAAITGGATLLAGRFGFALAPAIIHEIDS